MKKVGSLLLCGFFLLLIAGCFNQNGNSGENENIENIVIDKSFDVVNLASFTQDILYSYQEQLASCAVSDEEKHIDFKTSDGAFEMLFSHSVGGESYPDLEYNSIILIINKDLKETDTLKKLCKNTIENCISASASVPLSSIFLTLNGDQISVSANYDQPIAGDLPVFLFSHGEEEETIPLDIP